MSPRLIDLLERAIWTFLQAAAGVIAYAVAQPVVASGTGLDWRALLIAAATAGALSVAKTLGIQGSLLALLAQLGGTGPIVVDGTTTDTTGAAALTPTAASLVPHAGATPPPPPRHLQV